MDKQKPKEIIEQHELWLKTDGRDGKRAYLSGADLFEAALSRANLREADLSGANLCVADLSGANLCEANMTGANLTGANLTGANLSGANLFGADLEHTEIIGFYIGKHFGFYHQGDQYDGGDYLRIGCEGHSLNYWVDNYEEIGLKNKYGEEDIRKYGIQIKALKAMTRKRFIAEKILKFFQKMPIRDM